MRRRRNPIQSNYPNLPGELHTDLIAPYFKNNSQELSNLALTSKSIYNLFQPKRLVDTLLSYVACGNQDAAEKMLKKHPELMLERGSVIDSSGRHFKNISAFELTLWTLDVRYMGGMMLHCIPKGEKKDKIRGQLLEQYDNVQEKGVTYAFENTTVTESHFDFTPLINALETYVKEFNGWTFYECQKHWCTIVGKEQSKLPMHVQHHYCDPNEAFFPTPTFDKKEFKRSSYVYNYDPNELYCPRELVHSNGLIIPEWTYGILRGSRWFAVIIKEPPGKPLAPSHLDLSDDSAAIRSLCQARTADLVAIKKQLEQPAEELQQSCCIIC